MQGDSFQNDNDSPVDGLKSGVFIKPAKIKCSNKNRAAWAALWFALRFQQTSDIQEVVA